MIIVAKSIHIGLLLLLLLYGCEHLVLLLLKYVRPTSDFVRFWTPGLETALTCIAAIALAGILADAITRIRVSRSLLLLMHGAWLVCFTLIGWMPGGPFTLTELVRVDVDDPVAVSRAELTHFVGAAIVYLGIVVVVALPLLVHRRWRGVVVTGPHRGTAA